MKSLVIFSIIIVIALLSMSATGAVAKSPQQTPDFGFYNHPGFKVSLNGTSYNLSVPYILILEDGIPLIGLWNQSKWEHTDNGNFNRSYTAHMIFAPRIFMVLMNIEAMYQNYGGLPTGLTVKELLGTNISLNEPMSQIVFEYNIYLKNTILNLSSNLSNPMPWNITGIISMHNSQNIRNFLSKMSLNTTVYENFSKTTKSFKVLSNNSNPANYTVINSINSLGITYEILFQNNSFGNSTMFMFQNSYISSGIISKKVRTELENNTDDKLPSIKGYSMSLSRNFSLMYLWENNYTDNNISMNLSSYQAVHSNNMINVFSFKLKKNTSFFYEDPYLVFPGINIAKNLTFNNIGSAAINIILNNFEYFSGGLFIGLLMIGGGYSYIKFRKR
ncbi:MAG: hypothetical protein ACYDAO_03610 [Thermoplasmataceae archaeon]